MKKKILMTLQLFISTSVALQAYTILTTDDKTVSGRCDNGDGYSAIYDSPNFYISNTTGGGHATGTSFENAISKSCAHSPKKSHKTIVTLKKDSLVFYKEKDIKNHLRDKVIRKMNKTMAGLSDSFAYPRIVQKVQLIRIIKSPKDYIDDYAVIKTGDGNKYYVRRSAIY